MFTSKVEKTKITKAKHGNKFKIKQGDILNSQNLMKTLKWSHQGSMNKSKNKYPNNNI